MNKVIKIGWGNSVLTNPNFPVFVYFIIRSFSWFFLIGLAPDIVNQLNMAINISEGNGFVLSNYDFKTGCMLYSNYYSHPPFLSVLLFIYKLVFGDLIWSLFAIAITLSFFEALLVNSLLDSIGIGSKTKFGLMLFLGMYIGHLDRGLISDYFALIWAMWFIYNIYLLLMQRQNNLNSAYIKLIISLILMPFVKYTLIPLVFLPSIFLVLQLILKNARWAEIKLRFLIINFTSSISLFLVFLFIKQGPVSIRQEYFIFDWFNLLKVDYFWLHFGLELDRFYKYVSWNLPNGLALDFWNIGQIISLGIWCLVLIFCWRERTFFNRALAKGIVGLFVIATLLQVLFLAFLTITNVPQGPVKYGVDDKVWVFIEEARYYNYLTFFAFILFTLIVFNLRLRIFKVLLFLVVLSGYIFTFSSRFRLSNELPIFALASGNKMILNVISSGSQKIIKKEIGSSKKSKLLMGVYGYNE
jgi:hypothetical protein